MLVRFGMRKSFHWGIKFLIMMSTSSGTYVATILRNGTERLFLKIPILRNRSSWMAQQYFSTIFH